MKNGETRDKIIAIFMSESEDGQDTFISDLRRSLSETHGQFRKTLSFLLILLLSHFLSYSGTNKQVKILGTDFPEEPIFHAAILFVSAVVFVGLMCLSYLKKYQRECYILSLMLRYPSINSTGLHELRLPSDSLLGADMLRYDTHVPQRLIGGLAYNVISYAHFALPLLYIYNALKSFYRSGPTDIGAIFFMLLSFLCCVVAAVIMYFHVKIE